MTQFQPDQLNVLKSVINKNAIAATALVQDLGLVTRFTTLAEKFALQNGQLLGTTRFVLKLSPFKSGTKPLVASIVQSEALSGNFLIDVDSKLNFISSSTGNPTLEDSFKRTKSARSFEIVFHLPTVHYVVYGRHIHEDFIGRSGQALASQRWFRPFSQFGKILDDHMEGAVQYEKDLRYWADKKKRILLSGPDGTEKIFHGKLFWWLNNFLTDKLSVYGQTYGFGQDSTDITVITTNLTVHLIEVKWLGKNENKSIHNAKQINKALVQVKTYLKKDKDVLVGFLVIYDGRTMDKHLKNSKYNRKHLHPRCKPPILLFLESETPSQIGAKVT